MIKLLKKLWKLMIEIGNTVINFIAVGGTTPGRIDVGSTQVWPVTYYLTISPTAATINETQTTGTITVDTNLTNWQVYESLDWVTVSKGASSVSWTASTNTSSGRSGNIIVSGSGITQTFSLSQKGGYYVRILTSPYAIDESGGTIQIEVMSTYRDEYTPVHSGVTYSTGSDWIHFQSVVNNSTGSIFTFTCDRNTDVVNRIATFTFTQDAVGGSSASVSFTQRAMYVPASISGFTRFAYVGDWQIGTYVSSYISIGGQSVPVRAIAILNVNPTTAACVANYTVDYYTRTTGNPTYSSTSGPRNIATTDTVSIPDGDTAYGISITAGPNLTITGVTGFDVSEV